MQKQPCGAETMIFQVGKSGIYLGRVDFPMRAGKVVARSGELVDLRECLRSLAFGLAKSIKSYSPET
jgi:hypothetical protein